VRAVVARRAAAENSRRRIFLGLPAADFAVEGEHRQPCEQVQGEGDDLQPDLVLGGAVQGEVTQSGGAGGAAAVLGARPAAVAKFEVGELATGGVRDEDGEAVACAASSPL